MLLQKIKSTPSDLILLPDGISSGLLSNALYKQGICTGNHVTISSHWLVIGLLILTEAAWDGKCERTMDRVENNGGKTKWKREQKKKRAEKKGER